MSRTRKSTPAVPVVRCAIYTRKSTEEGLDQEFNTLDAQRESGEAYVRSQQHEGWEFLPDHYDDGGFTGGNMDRPALKRPNELATAIECFLRQDYPAELRELIVLNDAGQYENQVGDGWRIVSFPSRFRTLGEKRNASAGLVSPDVDAYCVWDDDDVYLPWHMTAAAAALADADYTIPTVIYSDKGNRVQRKSNQYLFHGAWSFRREPFEQVGGYPFIQSGQDQGLLRRFKAAKLRRADSIQHDPRPSYVYRWFTAHSTHISAMGADGYERLAGVAVEQIDKITPRWGVDWSKLAAAEMEAQS